MDIRLEPQDAHLAPLADKAVAEGDLQGPHLGGNRVAGLKSTI